MVIINWFIFHHYLFSEQVLQELVYPGICSKALINGTFIDNYLSMDTNLINLPSSTFFFIRCRNREGGLGNFSTGISNYFPFFFSTNLYSSSKEFVDYRFFSPNSTTSQIYLNHFLTHHPLL